MSAQRRSPRQPPYRLLIPFAERPAGNTARSTTGGIVQGGGLYFGSNGPDVGLTDATISANTATGGAINSGGDAYLGGSKTQVRNTLVTAGAAEPGLENCAGTPTSLGHNLDSRNQCDFAGTGDQVNKDPLLAPPQDNGGTGETLSLLSGSPAIDAGTNSDCPATDERGVLRPAGGACDIGAFEIAKPGAFTDVASAVAATTVTLHGSAFNPALDSGTAYFQYGTTTGYGNHTPLRPVAATTRAAAVSAAVSGVAPATHYHFRLVVTNATGTALGGDHTVTTAPNPPPTAPSPPTPPSPLRHRPKISQLKLTPGR